VGVIRARNTVVPAFADVPQSHCLNGALPAGPILPGQHYFAIVVDELFLAHSREWRREIDPMVLAITEFVHGRDQVVLPFVVGPRLLGDNGTKVPQGMLYRRTRVAGIHPFRGGRITSTVIFCQVKRSDYARKLLKVVESVAASVPFAAELGTYVR
jgi:hypothetical protein